MNNAVRGARRMASSEPFRFSGFSNFRQQYSAGGAASSDNSGSGSSSSSSSNGGSGGSSSSYNTVGGNGGNTFDESFNQNEFARSQSTGLWASMGGFSDLIFGGLGNDDEDEEDKDTFLHSDDEDSLFMQLQDGEDTLFSPIIEETDALESISMDLPGDFELRDSADASDYAIGFTSGFSGLSTGNQQRHYHTNAHTASGAPEGMSDIYNPLGSKMLRADTSDYFRTEMMQSEPPAWQSEPLLSLSVPATQPIDESTGEKRSRRPTPSLSPCQQSPPRKKCHTQTLEPEALSLDEVHPEAQSQVPSDGAAVVSALAESTAAAGASTAEQRKQRKHRRKQANCPTATEVGALTAGQVAQGKGPQQPPLKNLERRLVRSFEELPAGHHVTSINRPNAAVGRRELQSCHMCKTSFTLDKLVYCSSKVNKPRRKNAGPACQYRFCFRCMEKNSATYGPIPQTHDWSCPRCRNLCKCGACNK